MGVRLSIEGSESIKLQETSITGIEFGADIPHDSNARSTDLGSTVFTIYDNTLNFVTTRFRVLSYIYLPL